MSPDEGHVLTAQDSAIKKHFYAHLNVSSGINDFFPCILIM